MPGSQRKMLLYVIRFFVFAAVYIGIVLGWASRERGYAALGILGGGLILAGGAAVAWLAAAIIGRYVRNAVVRFAVHVVLVVSIFIAFAIIILLLLGFSLSHEDALVRSFVGIVAICALADGAVGLWGDQRKADAGG